MGKTIFICDLYVVLLFKVQHMGGMNYTSRYHNGTTVESPNQIMQRIGYKPSFCSVNGFTHAMNLDMNTGPATEDIPAPPDIASMKILHAFSVMYFIG